MGYQCPFQQLPLGACPAVAEECGLPAPVLPSASLGSVNPITTSVKRTEFGLYAPSLLEGSVYRGRRGSDTTILNVALAPMPS